MDYIYEVRALARFNTDLLVKGSINRIADDMEEREEIARDNTITKLRRLKRITSWAVYDIEDHHYGGGNMASANKVALRHTVQLINGLLKFEEKTVNDDGVRYERTVDDFTAFMDVNKEGFHLAIKNGDSIKLDRVVGGYKARTGFGRDWVKTIERVWKEVDLGLWRKRYGLSIDIFQVKYKVNQNNIEQIKTKLRKVFVDNGLMTRECNSEGYTVGSYGSEIYIRRMIQGDSFEDFVQAVELANAVLKSEGYTELNED